ncbi:uncharacterized protein BKA78DRAFT_310072 [Phyllosticta capitalensis]|uniref:uncharacterized protein n=1 Tax=Phyllosticta capitalensis TaxID=121624 RepID=UPI00312E1817
MRSASCATKPAGYEEVISQSIATRKSDRNCAVSGERYANSKTGCQRCATAHGRRRVFKSPRSRCVCKQHPSTPAPPWSWHFFCGPPRSCFC